MLNIKFKNLNIIILFVGFFSLGTIDNNINCDQSIKTEIGKKLSYKFTLEKNSKNHNYISRKLSLVVNDEQVGYVNYDISLDKNTYSYIQYLYVFKPFRASHGYGKILLSQALFDVISNGSTFIKLQRYPFDLLPDDNFQKRDAQLKSWYERFGFENENEYNSTMVLKNLDKFYKLNVFSFFGADDNIKFQFSSELKNI